MAPTTPEPLDIPSGLAESVLERAKRAGCDHAELRVERIRSQAVALRDGEIETTADDVESGIGLRGLFDGAIGFSATVAHDLGAAGELVDQAVEIARVASRGSRNRVELAVEEGHGAVEWTSPHRVAPVSVPLSDKVALLSDWSARVLGWPGIDHVGVSVLAVTEDKFYADLSGTLARQRRVRVHPQLEAVALGEGGDFETMRTLAPPAGRGWEYLQGDGWDWDSELARLPGLLRDKLESTSVTAHRYHLCVVGPTGRARLRLAGPQRHRRPHRRPRPGHGGHRRRGGGGPALR